jgi:hypothetical protein
MKKLIFTAAIGFFGTFAFGQTNFNEVKVDSYYKSDGTFVQEHWRTAPDNSFNNNWSTVGNTNPHTEKVGTKTSPSTTSSNYYYKPSSSSNKSNSTYNFNTGSSTTRRRK